jgi:hypothetical protein
MRRFLIACTSQMRELPRQALAQAPSRLRDNEGRPPVAARPHHRQGHPEGPAWSAAARALSRARAPACCTSGGASSDIRTVWTECAEVPHPCCHLLQADGDSRWSRRRAFQRVRPGADSGIRGVEGAGGDAWTKDAIASRR